MMQGKPGRDCDQSQALPEVSPRRRRTLAVAFVGTFLAVGLGFGCTPSAPAWEAPDKEGEDHVENARWDDARTAFRKAAELAEKKDDKERLTLKACGAWAKQSESLVKAGTPLLIETELMPLMKEDGCGEYYGETTLDEAWEVVAEARTKAGQFEKAYDVYEHAYNVARSDEEERARIKKLIVGTLKGWGAHLQKNRYVTEPVAKRLMVFEEYAAAAALYAAALSYEDAALAYKSAGNLKEEAANLSKAGLHSSAARVYRELDEPKKAAAAMESYADKYPSPYTYKDAANAYLDVKDVKNAKRMIAKAISRAVEDVQPSRALAIAREAGQSSMILEPLLAGIERLLLRSEPYEARYLLLRSLKYLEEHPEKLDSKTLNPFLKMGKKIAKALKAYPKIVKQKLGLVIDVQKRGGKVVSREFGHHSIKGSVKNTTKRHVHKLELRVRLIEVNFAAVDGDDSDWAKKNTSTEKALKMREDSQVEVFQLENIAPGETKDFEFKLATHVPYSTVLMSLAKFNYTGSDDDENDMDVDLGD